MTNDLKKRMINDFDWYVMKRIDKFLNFSLIFLFDRSVITIRRLDLKQNQPKTSNIPLIFPKTTQNSFKCNYFTD